jgi:hypothetical protein
MLSWLTAVLFISSLKLLFVVAGVAERLGNGFEHTLLQIRRCCREVARGDRAAMLLALRRLRLPACLDSASAGEQLFHHHLLLLAAVCKQALGDNDLSFAFVQHMCDVSLRGERRNPDRDVGECLLAQVADARAATGKKNLLSHFLRSHQVRRERRMQDL